MAEEDLIEIHRLFNMEDNLEAFCHELINLLVDNAIFFYNY